MEHCACNSTLSVAAHNGISKSKLHKKPPWIWVTNVQVSLFVCRYHHTAAINLVYALRESLALLAEEVYLLFNYWKRTLTVVWAIVGLYKYIAEGLISPSKALELVQ